MATTTNTTGTPDSEMLDARTTGYGMAFAITALFNTFLLVFKENVPGVQDLMTAVTGHHWISHGLLDLIVFVGLGIYLSRGGRQMTGSALTNWISGGVVIGGGLLGAYFLIIG